MMPQEEEKTGEHMTDIPLIALMILGLTAAQVVAGGAVGGNPTAITTIEGITNSRTNSLVLLL